MKKKEYSLPEISIVKFDSCDIVATSPESEGFGQDVTCCDGYEDVAG